MFSFFKKRKQKILQKYQIMQKLSTFALCLLFFVFLHAQTTQPEKLKAWEEYQTLDLAVDAINYYRPHSVAMEQPPLDEALAPFYHGVASGDPLADRVIIWTRVTPQDGEEEIEVSWEIATDPELINVVQVGAFVTNGARDFTVKVDVTGLQAGTTYYYGFSALGANSLTGRTKTATIGQKDRMRFAVVSCSNYQSGYFNAYARLAEKHDLEAILHLGDYIYEYGNNAGDTIGRMVEPTTEVINLQDYRARHSHHKLDQDLRKVHQQHPFICIWDDHETANNSWTDGAANHQASEGDWADRKAMGTQAYFEWMPIRDSAMPGASPKIYRSISYGDLVEVIMLDTRLEGRQEQASSATDPILMDPERTILGEEQYNWLLETLSNSTAKWKIIGNQVVFAPLNTAGLIDNLDGWDGYPAERNKVLGFIDSLDIDNVVITTGDIHIGIAADVTIDPNGDYDPETGEGSVAVEMVTPSVSTFNLDDVPLPLPIELDLIPAFALGLNPHGRFVNLVDHGYYIIDAATNQLQGDWYWVETVKTPTDIETQMQSWYTVDGGNHLQVATAAAPPIPDAPLPAPADPPGTMTGIDEVNGAATSGLVILSGYPNPMKDKHRIDYAVSKTMDLQVGVYDVSGKKVKELLKSKQQVGLYSLTFTADGLAGGVYFVRFLVGDGSEVVRKVVVAE